MNSHDYLTGNLLFPALVLMGFIAVLATVLLIFRKPKFQRVCTMTENELEFHKRLRAALPHHEIWPQVAMLALVAPKSRRGSALWRREFYEISNRRVDWVIAMRNQPICIIELDDKTHDKAKDKRRDAILRMCGYDVIRYQSKTKPSIEQIKKDIGSLNK